VNISGNVSHAKSGNGVEGKKSSRLSEAEKTSASSGATKKAADGEKKTTINKPSVCVKKVAVDCSVK